jgi:hypothetical protein
MKFFSKCIFFINYSVHILYILLAVYIQLHTAIILELLLYFQATERSLTFLTYCDVHAVSNMVCVDNRCQGNE